MWKDKYIEYTRWLVKQSEEDDEIKKEFIFLIFKAETFNEYHENFEYEDKK